MTLNFQSPKLRSNKLIFLDPLACYHPLKQPNWYQNQFCQLQRKFN